MSIAEVILDNALETPLDYSIPAEWEQVEVGMRVEVPLRGKTATGIIFALKKISSFPKTKSLIQLLGNERLVSQELFSLAKWMSQYYCTPLSKVLKGILPPSVRNRAQKHKMQAFVKPIVSKNTLRKTCESLRLQHPSQSKVLDVLLYFPKGLFLSEIFEKANVSYSPIKTLCKKKILTLEEVRVDRSSIFSHDFFPTKPKILNEEQQKALDAILLTLGKFQPHLLFGITGSGKTEIYLQVIQQVLQKEQGILYLVPEIALTSQMIERFKGRFGEKNIAILHHRLSEGERFDAWHKIRKGQAKIVIGARSAVFSPIHNLGLIIVDEEHEDSFKQSEEAPKYHARDVAVMRAKLTSCPIILGSATPSLESYTNALQGKYRIHRLTKRPNHASLPKVTIIDMKEEFTKTKGYTIFSEKLLNGIKKRIEKGEQTLLLLNRRGYHTSALCSMCCHVEKCLHCDLSLTFHRGDNILACHLCDFRKPLPKSCPSCHAEGPLKFKGVGTEMVEKNLHALFPDVRTLRLDADTTRHKGSHEKIFKQFRSGKADILIGTQMIAKGLHFPMVTLVGILGLDGSLHIPDFRSSEKVFQLLTQVAGRSGRGELLGEVFIQTQLPEHTTIIHAANQDFEGFYAEEKEARELFHFPPFSHLVKFSFAGKEAKKCEQIAKEFQSRLIATMPKEVEAFPVVPCGYAKIKENYRFQCLIKCKKIQKILPLLQQLRMQFKKGEVTLAIDVNPLSTFF